MQKRFDELGTVIDVYKFVDKLINDIKLARYEEINFNY